MSFKSLIKQKQNRKLSKTWRTLLVTHEIEKNNFNITGDLHKARDFAEQAAHYEPVPLAADIEPTVIYSREVKDIVPHVFA